MKISTSLFQKYNIPVPRYTSYPPATAFHTNNSETDYIQQLTASNKAGSKNISIYIHIPFCTQRCHFCGCNTALSQSEDRIEKYVNAVITEIKRVSQYIDKERFVTQVSWGGGTPNSIKMEYIAQIMSVLKQEFKFADFAEIAMECSPAYLDFEDADYYAKLGFNRISLGIQDFHQNVLDAINRKAPKHPVNEMLNFLRNKGFKGLNLDLVYGLPLQTVDSFIENIEKTIEIKPDRIATFSYAHIPWFNEAQRLMEHNRFPTAEEKLAMLVHAINLFSSNGYEVIGMDHFALKTDELAIAKDNKQLHRNFQGYNTLKTTGQVYAFGASGISQLNSAFLQNIKNYDHYVKCIESGKLAIEKSYLLTGEEIILRDTINQIMCNGLLDINLFCSEKKISVSDFYKITQFNVSKLDTFLNDGLLYFESNKLSVNAEGMLIIRNIASAFDPAFKLQTGKYSTTL